MPDVSVYQREKHSQGSKERGNHGIREFTDKARKVLVLAQEMSALASCHIVGAEHILLGLIQERTVSPRASTA